MVLHTGKYEELIVCSHEIAASTAQLVAASKVRLRARPGLWSGSPPPGCAGYTACGREALGWVVPWGPPCVLTHPHAPQVKANKDSRHLGRLQECSRTVNVMAANVVASTKSGQEQIEERGDSWGPGSGVGGGRGPRHLSRLWSQTPWTSLACPSSS